MLTNARNRCLAMRLDQPQARRRSAIALTPLIDVVFILLLFFMLASSLTRLHAVALQSQPTHGQHSDAPQKLLLRVQADGELELDGETLRVGELPAALASRLARQPDLSVIVKPADRVQLQALLDVFDELTQAGVSVLRLQ